MEMLGNGFEKDSGKSSQRLFHGDYDLGGVCHA